MPPGGRVCPTCGKIYTTAPADTPPTAKGQRKLRLLGGIRALVIVGVAIGLSGVMALAFFQGPPIAADPLTGTWVLNLSPGGYQSFDGAVTGGDFITGNFTVVTPPGAVVLLQVFNATEFGQFQQGRTAQPVQSTANQTSSLLDFSALVTDTYYFVFEDQYSAASHIGVTVYVSTQYESNVVVE
ncbi:MAG TPA: hypothetical protein VGV89_00550 [Thermoplasmata archaeon]|nr:hypothetical protein [Thermoplasmata archaeon]